MDAVESYKVGGLSLAPAVAVAAEDKDVADGFSFLIFTLAFFFLCCEN